jgi:hypothetical protein
MTDAFATTFTRAPRMERMVTGVPFGMSGPSGGLPSLSATQVIFVP